MSHFNDDANQPTNTISIGNVNYSNHNIGFQSKLSTFQIKFMWNSQYIPFHMQLLLAVKMKMNSWVVTRRINWVLQIPQEWVDTLPATC